MTDLRTSVRDTARYLHRVRPIDPEELSSYVAGNPHPGVIRRVLREEAVDLELVEREDGTFTPVESTPVPSMETDIESIPSDVEHRIEAILTDRYGERWYTGESGESLRSTIKEVKRRYFEQESVTYTDPVASAYLVYHFPGYFASTQYALNQLARQNLLGRQLSVLDVGAGTGAPAIGVERFCPSDTLIDYHALEPSDARKILSAVLDTTGRNFHVTTHSTPVEEFDPDRRFDLVLFCNVLSELDDPEETLRRSFDWVQPDGSVLALAPADKETSIHLRDLERAVEDDVTINGPTVRLWPGERPTDRGWSFDVRPDLAVPSFQQKLQDSVAEPGGDGSFINVDVKFSYSILRLDSNRQYDIELDDSRWAKMAEMDQHVTNRVDLVAAKLSASLHDRGTDERSAGHPIYKISDGSERIDHYAVLTDENRFTRILSDAEYGEVLAFENVLVLWNEDEHAYNLVIDSESIVDRFTPVDR